MDLSHRSLHAYDLFHISECPLCFDPCSWWAHPVLISGDQYETSHCDEKSGHVWELHCWCWKVSYQGGFIIKLVPKPKLWEMAHLLCKVARNPPVAHLQNFSSGLHRRRWCGKNAFMFHNPPPHPPPPPPYPYFMKSSGGMKLSETNPLLDI